MVQFIVEQSDSQKKTELISLVNEAGAKILHAGRSDLFCVQCSLEHEKNLKKQIKKRKLGTCK